MNSVDTTSYLEMTTTSLYSPVIRPHERLIDEDEPVSKKTYETTCEPVYHSPNGMIPDKSQSPRITSSTEIILVRRRPSTDLRSSPSSAPVTVSKRNERERNRVKLVNMGFHTLRQHIPNGSKGKMSKVETLRSAVEYIRALQSVLNDDQPLDEVQSLTNFMCLKNLENCISYQ